MLNQARQLRPRATRISVAASAIQTPPSADRSGRGDVSSAVGRERKRAEQSGVGRLVRNGNRTRWQTNRAFGTLLHLMMSRPRIPWPVPGSPSRIRVSWGSVRRRLGARLSSPETRPWRRSCSKAAWLVELVLLSRACCSIDFKYLHCVAVLSIEDSWMPVAGARPTASRLPPRPPLVLRYEFLRSISVYIESDCLPCRR